MERRYHIIWLVVAGIIWGIMLLVVGTTVTLLGVYFCYEALTYFTPRLFWYILPVGIAFIPSEVGSSVQLMMAILIGVIYCQHDFIVEPYRKREFDS